MNQGGEFINRLRASPALLAAAGAISGFALALFGIYSFGLPVWSLLIVVVIIAYAFLVTHRPVVGLLAVICIYFLPFQLGDFTLMQLCGAGTSVLMLIWVFHQQRTIRLDPILLPLFLLGLLVFAAFAYARDTSSIPLVLRLWAFNMIFILIMTNLVTRLDVFKKVLWTIILVAAVNAAGGIIKFASYTDINNRTEGLVGSATRLGHLSCIAFPLAFYQFLYRTDRLRWLALGVSGLLLIGVVLAAGRTPTLAIIIVLLAIMVTERRRAVPVILVAVRCLSVVPFLPGHYTSRVANLAVDVKNSIVLGSNDQLTDRGMLNKASIKIWARHPVLGIGIGNFGHYFIERQFNPGFKRSNKVPPHNVYLQALVEMGLVGFAVMLWVIILSVWRIILTRRIAYEKTEQWAYLGGVQMMTVAVLISHSTTGHVIGKIFWLFLSLAAISHQIAVGDRTAAPLEEKERQA